MRHIIPLFALTVALGATAERICIDNDWRFAFGHTDPARDYGSGTEYFNYLTKAASVHNIGPYAMKFNDSTWTEVDLPHDFVADLPFAREASHSHGYNTVGYKYPETSVGWYRKVLPVAAEDSVMRLSLVFDGIFRDSRVWFNGFYLGGEPSGYTQQTYDITPYVNWGGDNVIAVRSDATLEEGWFYEGGGIYRHAWLDRKAPRHIADNSIATSFVDGPNSAVTVSGRIANRLYGVAPADNETWTLNAVLIDPQGNKAAEKTIDITSQLRRMIDRDRNHPSVIMWSVGNEEWGVEWDEKGRRIVSELRDVCHRLDPTRPMTVATSGGPMPIIPADVAGYNYIMQNPVEKYRAEYPARCAYGSEETSGCGTRGVYFDDRENGRMASLNRIPDSRDSCLNRIERGWRFYADRPWLAGLFYWTGFDYRGEPNPLEYPATGSEFGLLDYCGFPKDEAWYLKSWWTDEPVLHVFPHWNLEGHEGETIDLWVYSNMDEVELIVNGKNLGRKTMPRNGHLSWPAVYRPGSVEARGYRNGRRVMTRKVETTGQAVRAIPDYAYSKDDIQIINVSLVDSKGRTVPTACNPVTITYGNHGATPGQDCGIRLLGAGNGDPAFRGIERPAPGSNPASFTIPAFNGHAQFIIHNPHSCPVSITLSDTTSTDD
ncbi:DUF4982 domain-containing protein [uncultured Duncaniella sp.]|jgi:hypothetical protein|uniref:DUF4982 domain-containing protein n=2 Tax=uncultured Duncaniella sp. TaxID=2768039 RepID=UPI002589F20C|nr:DUF4982 domain-containing protein [uncultured Duncaniella sp.]